MTAPRFPVMPCGDDALRVLCGAGPVRHALARHLRSGDWIDIVPGTADVTVVFDLHAGSQKQFSAALETALGVFTPGVSPPGKTHRLAARFGGNDGPDLARLAADLSLSPTALIDQVLNTPLHVDMIGFTPGFAYLTGLNPTLEINRLASPRVRVPAGSIGLITGQVGLYALEGPGGWPLIGRVTTPLFDPSTDEPFRLAPGDRVTIFAEP